MIEVRKATLEDALYVAEHIRDADALEIEALSYAAPESALRASFEATPECYAVTLDGETVAVFGASPSAWSPSVANIWLMGTERLEEISYEFTKQSRAWVDLLSLSGTYRVMKNYVRMDNELHVRWLKWLGAKFLGPEIRGFRRFEIYR